MIERSCDILVIGGGGAAVTAALTAAQHGADVLLVCKDHAGYGNTRIIGGVMAYGDPDCSGSGEDFFRDLVVGGEFLNDQKLCRILAREAPQATILLERFGGIVKRDQNGTISSEALLQPGGHSIPRAVIIPSTGPGVGQSLRFGLAQGMVPVLEQTIVVDLITEGTTVLGALGYQMTSGKTISITAGKTILATGGAGWMYYPHTDNSRVATGDGFALALNAGAHLIDMEQVQFIPFALTNPPGMVGCIVGEPFTAGPCGTLKNIHDEEILTNVAQSTRAKVSKAIILEVERGNGSQYGGCLLDLKANKEQPQGQLLYHYYTKGIFRSFNELVHTAYGPAAAAWEEPWDVYPSAHYSMGGVVIDEWARVKGVESLFACGEVTGGVHGGNRLGSVSMTELFIFGKRAGEKAAQESAKSPKPTIKRALLNETNKKLDQLMGKKGTHRVIDLKRKLQSIMWHAVGPARKEETIKQGLQGIDALAHEFKDISIAQSHIYNTELVDAIELGFMLPLAKSMALSALTRTESRGAHVHLDYPDRNDSSWLNNIIVKRGLDGELKIQKEPVDLCYLQP